MTKVLISDLKSILNQAAKSGPAEAETAGAAIAAARPEIEKLRVRGFSDRQIVDVLRSAGVRVSKSTLSAHLRAQKPAQASKKEAGDVAESVSDSVVNASFGGYR